MSKYQRLMMERFRKRNDAEEYVKVIRRMQPGEKFEIVFEVELKPFKAENQSGEAIALLWL